MDDTNNNPNECSECKSTFIRQSDMIRHIKRFHPSKAEEIITALENVIYPFKCDECDKAFSHRKNLNFHLKTHLVLNSGVKIRNKCPLCDHVAIFKKDFYDHCREIHNILLDVEKMDFSSTEDFMNWKSEIEVAMNSKFVKEYGSTEKMTNYICDQSEYSILENGVEKESTQDSKVNGFCPAGFRVLHGKDGKCSMYFVKTHICRQNKNLTFPNNGDENVQKVSKKRPKGNKNSNNTVTVSEKSENDREDQNGEVSPSNTSPKKVERKTFNAKNKLFIAKKKEMIKHVVNTLNSISNIKELEAVQELINPIKPILNILQNNSQLKLPKAKTSKVVKKSDK